MNEVSETIIRWLEQKRQADRTMAAVISVIAFGCGGIVFLLMTLLVYAVLFIVSGSFVRPVRWTGPLALGLMTWFFARSMKRRSNGPDLNLDPLGFWILKDISSVGPRLLLEGLQQMRCWEQLGELNVTACARALAYLANQTAAVDCEDLMRHCPQIPWERLREQLLLVEGVLFLGKDASRVTLMDPFRLRLRWMLQGERPPQQEPARPKAESAPQGVSVTEPEKLSAYELLGLSPSATAADIKAAYRKRIKECHPDHFAAMDDPAKALAERWTKALNAAYATLKPRQRGAEPNPTRH